MKKEEILAQVAAGKLSVDEAAKLLADQDTPKRGALLLQSERQRGRQPLRFATYARHTLRRAVGTAADFADELREFLKEHDSELKRKER